MANQEKYWNKGRLNFDELNALSRTIAQNHIMLMEKFGLSFKERGDKLVGCCPIHRGDNKTAFNFFHKDKYKMGTWVCRSHHCEELFNKSAVGFVRALLTSTKTDWLHSREEKDIFSFQKTLDFIIDLLGKDYINIDIDFIPMERKIIELDLPLDYPKKNLNIPCPFFSKKFEKQVLKKFQIGHCSTRGSKMNFRTVVPIYDIDYTKVIACQGRAIYGKCIECEGYHKAGKCLKWPPPKWKASVGFASDLYLYNQWNLKKECEKTKTLILTESVGNVLRLEEFGITCAAATFGTQFSKSQREIVDSLGVERVIWIPDADAAGEKIADRVTLELKNDYTVLIPRIEMEDDIAAVPKKEFEEKILKKIEELI